MKQKEVENFSLSHYQREGAFVHFIGCGGVGTAPLLRIFSQLGFRVSGSDMAQSKVLTALKEANYRVFCGHRKENLPPCKGEDLLVVYSSAIGKENEELLEAERRGARCILRGEALGKISQLFSCVIAVTGTHGKTSISSMILHILEKAGFSPGYLTGGEIPGREWSGSAGDKKIFICEADESDGTHTLVQPACAVVSNIEDDHVWNFASENMLLENFRSFGFSAPCLVYNEGEKTDLLYYGKHENSLRVEKKEREKYASLLKIFPLYQKENAFLAAKCVEKVFQKPLEESLQYLQDFPGVGRRLTLHYQALEYTLIEDYAHHPSEVAASLKSLRKMYKNSELYLVFQPHRYARLERYFSEFISQLKEKEYSPEKVYIAPVFAAWTEKGKMGAGNLAEKVGKKAQLLEGSWEEMAETVMKGIPERKETLSETKRVVIAVMGAGDVQKILPFLKEKLKKRDCGERTGVIVAAGGSSRRYGEKNKLFEPLGGLELFLYALADFVPFLPSGHLVLVVPSLWKKEFAFFLEKYAYMWKGKKILLAEGGSCREESVYNGIQALPEKCRILAIHDAARPFAGTLLLLKTVLGAEKYGGSIAAKRVTDTIKETDENGVILRTVDRERLRAVQTPQTFRKEILLEAFDKGKDFLANYTDDSSLVEEYTSCCPVAMENNGENIKITYPEDLFFAERLLKMREEE